MMKTGREILMHIDGQAAGMRTQINTLNENISQAQKDIETYEKEELSLYTELAKLRLELFQDGELEKKLNHAETEIEEILAQREKKRIALDQRLAENQQLQDVAEDERLKAAKALDTLDKKIKSAEAKTLKTLEKTNPYNANEAHIDKIEAQIGRITSKIELATSDYDEKILAYKSDPLFMYLWDREFGTSGYKISLPLIRFLDRWTSRICDYEAARRNFSALSSIPTKLRSHKERLEDQIDALEEAQDKALHEALSDNGILTLQADHDEKNKHLEQIDAHIHELEESYQDILQQKQAILENTDSLYTNALSSLSESYQNQSLKSIRKAALSTSTQKDDQLIHRFYALDDKIDDAKNRLHSYRKAIDAEHSRLRDVQDIRKTFKHKRYDSAQTSFSDGNMFSILLGQFVTGVLTNHLFWEAVARLAITVFAGGHEYSSRRHNRSYRSSNRSRRSSSRRRSRSSSQRSRGGFRTGGGF